MVRSKQIMVQSSINHDSESIIIYMIIIIINHDSEDIGCFCKLCWLSKSDPGLASNILQDHHRHHLVHLEIIKKTIFWQYCWIQISSWPQTWQARWSGGASGWLRWLSASSFPQTNTRTDLAFPFNDIQQNLPRILFTVKPPRVNRNRAKLTLVRFCWQISKEEKDLLFGFL